MHWGNRGREGGDESACSVQQRQLLWTLELLPVSSFDLSLRSDTFKGNFCFSSTDVQEFPTMQPVKGHCCYCIAGFLFHCHSTQLSSPSHDPFETQAQPLGSVGLTSKSTVSLWLYWTPGSSVETSNLKQEHRGGFARVLVTIF